MEMMLKRVGIVLMAAIVGPMVVAGVGPKNGAVWYDTNGHVLNAHGSGVLAQDGRYYLYGEHKVYGEDGKPFVPKGTSTVFVGGGQPGFAETASVEVNF